MYQGLLTGGRPQTTLTNLITNGNFANTDNWTGGGAALSAANNILSVTGTGAASSPEVNQITGLDCVENKILYIKCLARVTNAVSSRIRINVFGTTGGAGTILTQLSPAENTWYPLAENFTLTAAFTGKVQPDIFSTYVDAATANGKVLQLQKVILLDLTATFGAGLEPTAEQVSRWLDIFSAGWFDTIKAMPKRIY